MLKRDENVELVSQRIQLSKDSLKELKKIVIELDMEDKGNKISPMSLGFVVEVLIEKYSAQTK